MVDASRPIAIPGVQTLHRREDWQSPSEPVKGPAPTLEQVDTFPLHYTAADNLIDGDPGEHASMLPQYLRNIQHSYITNRGYSIGYGFAVDWLGGVWELRGYDIKNAANLGWNHRTLPVLCLVDWQDPLTSEALWSVRALYREANRRTGRSLNDVGHRDIGSTRCPGDGIYAQIQQGLVTPLTDAELGGEDDDMETIDPGRWLDGEEFAAGQTREFPAPFGALEFSANFTTEGRSEGFVTVWGHGTRPGVSTVRLRNGFNDNSAEVKTGMDGKVRIWASQACEIWADVQAKG